MNFDRLDDFRVILSMPFPVVFAGWKSDTATLQYNGWQLSVNENHIYQTIELGLYHPESQMRGIGSMTCNYPLHYLLKTLDFKSLPPIAVQTIAGDIRRITTESRNPFAQLTPIDAEPAIHQMSYREYSMSETPFIFRQLPKEEPNKIILEKASIQEILNMAIQKQEPIQRKIRERIRREAGLEAMKISSRLHTELHVL